LRFIQGKGEIGIENQGLNRWGMNFVAGESYEGRLWLRAEKPASVFAALESRDGTRVYAEARLEVGSGTWERVDFRITPNASDKTGRFTIKMKQPGAIQVGYAFLQPGEWGRFKGLPVRKDVIEALMEQGITVLRYGGSMVNCPEYRWRKMIGPPDFRTPYQGTWYPYSSNGWGILDFINMCRAAGFLCIPAFNMDETPRDMADFIEYVNGPANSVWGGKRASDGHPEPYALRYLELGNEERVDESYWQRFKPMAEAIWAKDSDITIVVGDFAYNRVIEDPFNFEGGAAVRTLAAHKKILDLAREHDREVWFDIHISTEQPPQPNGLRNERSFIEQLGKISPGAKYKVAIFEFNSGNHAMKRALSNACGINQAERIGDKMPIACSANCLQPDGQNDNGWNQGLLFLNPSQVWLQPPGYVTRMVSRNYQPLCVKTEVRGADGALDVSAKRSEDGKALALQVVNIGDKPMPAEIRMSGFAPSKPVAMVEELAGALETVNTAEEPDRVKPKESEWRHGFADGSARYTFAPYSFTIIRFE
jgi:alpha-L-arabinofuranosidase